MLKRHTSPTSKIDYTGIDRRSASNHRRLLVRKKMTDIRPLPAPKRISPTSLQLELLRHHLRKRQKPTKIPHRPRLMVALQR
ncbi:hypothetical protein GJ629_00240 [Halapricum sp. CBA1109]|nr:hypothetical protein [Halapricum sp. CBA1109]